MPDHRDLLWPPLRDLVPKPKKSRFERRCRETKRIVLWGRAEEFNLSPEDGKWVTICKEHGQVCFHATRQVAEAWAAHPLTWCERCNGNDPRDHDPPSDPQS